MAAGIFLAIRTMTPANNVMRRKAVVVNSGIVIALENALYP